MARCGCSGAFCACLIEGLDTTFVTTDVSGTGSADDPFVVSSTVTLEDLAVFFKTGTLTVSTGSSRFKFPFAVTLVNVTAAVNTAPTGAAILIDVNKNGTTIFTTQANRPTIAIGAFKETTDAVPNVTAIANDDYLTVDIDQIGSTIAGADLTVFVRYIRS